MVGYADPNKGAPQEHQVPGVRVDADWAVQFGMYVEANENKY